MRRLPRWLKVLSGVIGVLAILEFAAVIAWAAGAPTEVVIPVFLGLLATGALLSRRREWLLRLRRGSV